MKCTKTVETKRYFWPRLNKVEEEGHCITLCPSLRPSFCLSGLNNLYRWALVMSSLSPTVGHVTITNTTQAKASSTPRATCVHFLLFCLQLGGIFWRVWLWHRHWRRGSVWGDCEGEMDKAVLEQPQRVICWSLLEPGTLEQSTMIDEMSLHNGFNLIFII